MYLDKKEATDLANVELIIRQSTGLNGEELRLRTRLKKISHSRFMAWYLLKENYEWSYVFIGDVFGYHYSTVIHGVEKIKEIQKIST